MGKKISNILFIIYVAIAIFVTICLVSYNQFKVTEFGNKSLLLITDDGLSPDFNKGDLVILDKSSKIITGKKAFFYMITDRKVEVKLGTVDKLNTVTNSETTYTFEGDRNVSGEYVLGPADTAEIIPVVGGILNVLESKWGFLFLIVLPSLIAFIYQISVVIENIRNIKESE